MIAKVENVEVRWESQRGRRRRLLGRLVQEELVRCGAEEQKGAKEAKG